MADEKPLKSSYELAMERLRAKDRQEGIDEAKPLSDSQKDAITEARSEAKAKLAELEILFKKNLSGARGDPTEVARIEENYQRDRARIEDRLESKIARIRG